MTDVIQTRREGAVLEVTLDRPKANAIDLVTSRIMGLAYASFLRENRDTAFDFPVLLTLGEYDKTGKVPQYNWAWAAKTPARNNPIQ